MFKRSLRFEKYGYRSLIELCANLPEIFQYVQPTLDDYLLYDKNKTIPPFEQANMASLALWDMGSILIPPDVLHPGDKIPRYPIGDSYQVGDYLDIAVGEIYDPSKFWITDPYGKLKPLMNNLQINYQYNVLEIYLADISSEHNIFYINDVLVKEGHALYTNQCKTDPDYLQ
ncbi:hypothetical protein BDFB_012591, partial [Asbolus verrucosus]